MTDHVCRCGNPLAHVRGAAGRWPEVCGECKRKARAAAKRQRNAVKRGPRVCKCGCGQPVADRLRFILGHYPEFVRRRDRDRCAAKVAGQVREYKRNAPPTIATVDSRPVEPSPPVRVAPTVPKAPRVDFEEAKVKVETWPEVKAQQKARARGEFVLPPAPKDPPPPTVPEVGGFTMDEAARILRMRPEEIKGLKRLGYLTPGPDGMIPRAQVQHAAKVYRPGPRDPALVNQWKCP